MTATLNEAKYPEDIASLELTEDVKSAGLVNYDLSSFKSKTVILELNQNGSHKLVKLPILLEDWEETTTNFDSILQDLLRLLNTNAKKIVNHFVEHQRCARKDCSNKVTRSLRINFINQQGWFCENCAADLATWDRETY